MRGVVTTCDAHDNTNGKGHINPTGAGHFKDKGKTNNGNRTIGGTEDGVLPKGSNKAMSIHKDYTIDYTSTLKNVIMEQEHGSGGLTYRYVYGLTKLSVTIHDIPNGVGSVAQSYTYPNGKESVVKLYYHRDRLFTTDYLTDNISGKITSFAEYDPWGAPLSKAVVRLSVRELDLVLQYTVHPYDQVLGLYFAQARMYDAQGRRFLASDPHWNPGNMFYGDEPWVLAYINVPDITAIMQSSNLYVYVINNPVKWIDPSGLWMVGDDYLSAITQAYTRFYGSLWVHAQKNNDQTKMDEYHRLANNIRNMDKAGVLLPNCTGSIKRTDYTITYYLSYEYLNGIGKGWGSDGHSGYRFTGLFFIMSYNNATYVSAGLDIDFSVSGPYYNHDNTKRGTNTFYITTLARDIKSEYVYAIKFDTIYYYDANEHSYMGWNPTVAGICIYNIGFNPGGGRSAQKLREEHLIYFLNNEIDWDYGGNRVPFSA